MPRFAELIRAEATEQRRLRAAGEPIPPEKRKYARRACLYMALLCGAAAALIAAIGFSQGVLYYGVALFLSALAVIGVGQAITGRHLITGRSQG